MKTGGYRQIVVAGAGFETTDAIFSSKYGQLLVFKGRYGNPSHNKYKQLHYPTFPYLPIKRIRIVENVLKTFRVYGDSPQGAL